MELERYFKKITESLKLLSLNFKEQKAYFPDFVDIPFEILDTFENAFMLLPQLLESNEIAYDVVPNLLRLHYLIIMELKKPEFEKLNVEKLCNSDEWNSIRNMSKEILKIMGEPIEKPDPNFL
ncbi:MAG: hypothetical protein WAT22_12145 [Saprospiraceae bacterium]|jgi:hypothetical protein|nr:hypothetical protein [Saprospiraceae bacterium]